MTRRSAGPEAGHHRKPGLRRRGPAAAAGAVAAAFLALAGFAWSSPGLSLETLLERIGGKQSQQARFTEKKYLAVLDAPVESSGVLRYQAPGRLEKHTERPQAESMILDGDLVVLEREGRKRTLPLNQIPGVAALVGGLRDTLAGDAGALRDRFKVVVQGDERRWQIDLLPADPESATLVSRITLIGSQGRLDEVQTLQADGDRSVMTLSPR